MSPNTSMLEIPSEGFEERHFEEVRQYAHNLTKMLTNDTGFYDTPEHGWTCFHCGMTFCEHTAAAAHFGSDAIYGKPVCRTGAALQAGGNMAAQPSQPAISDTNPDLGHLFQKLKMAPKGSRELDAEVYDYFGIYPPLYFKRVTLPTGEIAWRDEGAGLGGNLHYAGPVTTSRDAATAIMEAKLPDGCSYQARGAVQGRFHHFVIEDAEGVEYEGRNCATLLLAICVALLLAEFVGKIGRLDGQ